MPFRIFLLSLCLLSSAPHAQESAEPAPAAPASSPLKADDLLRGNVPRNVEERDDMVDRAQLLNEEAKRRRESAEQTQAAAKAECWKKFLVSACLDEARVAYRKEVSIAKRQEREAKTLERNVRKYDAAEHARLRDEENARKDAENAKRSAEYRAKRAAEEQERAAKRSAEEKR